jgi:tellurite resistance protein TehA-like permease
MSRPITERWKYWLVFGLVFAIGGTFAAPFAFAIYRLIDCHGQWLTLDPITIALRAAIGTMFAGVVLSILLLFYRLKDDDTSPSLTSGMLVIALGAALTALVIFAGRPRAPRLEEATPRSLSPPVYVAVPGWPVPSGCPAIPSSPPPQK